MWVNGQKKISSRYPSFHQTIGVPHNDCFLSRALCLISGWSNFDTFLSSYIKLQVEKKTFQQAPDLPSVVWVMTTGRPWWNLLSITTWVDKHPFSFLPTRSQMIVNWWSVSFSRTKMHWFGHWLKPVQLLTICCFQRFKLDTQTKIGKIKVKHA